MVWLLKFLVFGHVHRWKILSETPLTCTHKGMVLDRGTRFHLQCEKCGDVMKRDLI